MSITHTVGFVYVLSNKAMPGIVKVGMTTKLAEDRAKQLHTTGVPLPFDVEFRALTSRPHEVEQCAHKFLESFRISPKREYFQVSPDIAIDTVRDALLAAAGIDAWETRTSRTTSGTETGSPSPQRPVTSSWFWHSRILWRRGSSRSTFGRHTVMATCWN